MQGLRAGRRPSGTLRASTVVPLPSRQSWPPWTSERDEAEEAFCTRQHVAALLESPNSSPSAKALHFALVMLILFATFLTIVETVPEVRPYLHVFLSLDYGVTVLFTLEFMLRLYAAETLLAFCTNVYNVVDVICLAPGYMEFWLLAGHHEGSLRHIHQTSSSMRTLRMIRVLRLARVIRIVGESESSEQMFFLFRVMCQIAQAGLLVIFSLLGITVLIAATLIYLFEGPICLPETTDFSVGRDASLSDGSGACIDGGPFSSIPSSVWWALITLTTVGYGDVVPTTVMGKLCGGALCLIGSMIMAVTAAQFSVVFRQHWVREKAQAHFRKRFAKDEHLAQEHQELQAALGDFQERLDALLLQVTCLSVEGGCGSSRVALTPFLMAVKEQGSALNAGFCSFVYEVLANSCPASETASYASGRPDAPSATAPSAACFVNHSADESQQD